MNTHNDKLRIGSHNSTPLGHWDSNGLNYGSISVRV